MTKALQDIWQDALAMIRDSVPVERYQPLVPEHGADRRRTRPPAASACRTRSWATGSRSTTATWCAARSGRITGRDVRVRFVVSPELYRTSREEELRQKQHLVEALDTSLPRNAAVAPESGTSVLPCGLRRGRPRTVSPSPRRSTSREVRDGSLNPLVVHGPVGLGKTHLLKGIVNAWNENERGSALFMSAESFTNQFLAALQHDSLDAFHGKFEDIELFALDDLQFLADKPATQDEFLQIYNGWRTAASRWCSLRSRTRRTCRS